MKRIIWVIAMSLTVTSVGMSEPKRFEPCDQHSCKVGSTGSAACINIGCLGGCEAYPPSETLGFCASSET